MEINRLSAKNNQLQEDYQKLEHDYNNIKDRYERAIKLYPNIHAKITDMIEEEIRQQDMKAAKNADSIIAKGQGNFETMHQCGKNIYYIFMCKCTMFMKRFSLPQFTGVLISEKNI